MRYTGSDWKRSRRLGFSTLETGKELKKRPYGPGQHGNARKKKLSEYGKQLTEKQKLRQMYGVNERQFRRLFMIALASKEVTGVAFMKLLESRLDTLVYRMGFARTRRGARQLVNHRHITVNGKPLNIPSYLVKAGDVIEVKENKQEMPFFTELKNAKLSKSVKWLEFNTETLKGSVIALPTREDIDMDIQEHMIVELYSK